MPPKGDPVVYEELVKRLLSASVRKTGRETWKNQNSQAAATLVATVNKDFTAAILEYRQKAEKPRLLTPKSLASLILKGHADGEAELENLISALKAQGFKATLSLSGFTDRLSGEVVETKKTPAPQPASVPVVAKKLSQKIARSGDAFDFPPSATSADDRIKWAYDQSELPDKRSLLFFLRDKPGGRQELVAVDTNWNGFQEGQTGAALPLILKPEKLRVYDPAKDECDDVDYEPMEVKATGKIPGGEYPVELSNGILGCGWSQVRVNGELVTVQGGGQVVAKGGAYRVQVRDGQNFDDIVGPDAGKFAYDNLALTYDGEPCSLDDRWRFTAFGSVVADPDRYLAQAKALLTKWSSGGVDRDTGTQYMYADLASLKDVRWTDGNKLSIPMHVSVETSNFDEKLTRLIKRGDAPKPGYFKDMGFHVTVAYYTLQNPHGYDSRNARAYRSNSDWATQDRAVKIALAQAGYTFKEVLKMGQDFLNNKI